MRAKTWWDYVYSQGFVLVLGNYSCHKGVQMLCGLSMVCLYWRLCPCCFCGSPCWPCCWIRSATVSTCCLIVCKWYYNNIVKLAQCIVHWFAVLWFALKSYFHSIGVTMLSPEKICLLYVLYKTTKYDFYLCPSMWWRINCNDIGVDKVWEKMLIFGSEVTEALSSVLTVAVSWSTFFIECFGG